MSRGKKTDFGSSPVSKSAKTEKPGKAAPVAEAIIPLPEIKFPPTLWKRKNHQFEAAGAPPVPHAPGVPYKMQDDKSKDDLARRSRMRALWHPPLSAWNTTSTPCSSFSDLMGDSIFSTKKQMPCLQKNRSPSNKVVHEMFSQRLKNILS